MSECLTKLADPAQNERRHYGLAVSCASRFYGRGVPREELIGEAEAALLWAATRFDESRGTRFSSYAIPFVLGALKELCRKATPMHVPRTELRVLGAAESARETLRNQSGREPTVGELSAAVGVEPERLSMMLAAKERMQRTEGDVDPRELSAASAKEGFEDLVLLKDVIMSLGRPYAQVLWLRFGVGFSQTEVARRFGISQSQLSRWENLGKGLLREKLQACY